jgi:hypothetical protein
MKQLPIIVVAAWLGLSAGSAFAQPGAASGPGPGPKAAAAGASGPGMGMGPGSRRGPMGRWGSDNTPGWTMMTPQERSQHQERMRSMNNYDECKAYQTQHHEQMAARAKERGGKPLAAPRRDACAGLKR